MLTHPVQSLIFEVICGVRSLICHKVINLQRSLSLSGFPYTGIIMS